MAPRLWIRRTGIALAGVALVAAVASVGASGGSTATRGTAASATLTATGSSATTYTPDLATIGFAADSQAVTAAGAIAANAAIARKIIDALQGDGVARISTQAISLSPRYNRDSTAIVGYSTHNAVIGTMDTAKVGAVIDDAVAAGATRFDGPTFSSSTDTEALYRAALRKAVVEARERAEALADAAGVKLSRIVSIEPGSGSSIGTATTAGATTPVIAPTLQVSASVTLTFAIG